MVDAPTAATPRALVDEAIAAGDAERARVLLQAFWEQAPGPMSAGFVAARFEAIADKLSLTAYKLAILRSCTLEPVVPVLRAAAFCAGFRLEVQVGDFNAYAQELLDPSSSLYRFAPDAVILGVLTRDIVPELWNGFAGLGKADIDAVRARFVGEFRAWLAAFRQNSRSHLVVHGLELPPVPALGALDAQSEHSQAESLRALNGELRALLREHSGMYFLDYDALIARHGREHWSDARKWHTARLPLRAERLSDLAAEWLRFLQPLGGRVCKALAVDLDNTLWGGVIGEDGINGIQLGAEHPGVYFLELQRAMLDLKERGVVLAVCSKNNPADALEAIEKHPHMLLRQEHFAALRINWEDKASNLRAIARELNIGSDAIAFLDDNPAERELVRQQAPEITVLPFPSDPTRYASSLREAAVFERLSLSAEDRERGRYYAEERQRAELEKSSTSLEDFYRSLRIEVRIDSVTPATLTRTAQLTQKTNQFNLTTRRYSEQEVSAMLDDPATVVTTVSARDRFGDNGLIGVAITRDQAEVCEIDTLLLSCRVIGRTIETAILSAIAARGRERGLSRIVGSFIPTKKNAPAKEFFPSHGFRCTHEDAQHSTWELSLEGLLPSCPAWVDCRVESSQTERR